MIADRPMNSGEILQGDFALLPEDFADKVRATGNGDVPFFNVTDSLGVFHPRYGRQSDIAEGSARKSQEYRLVGVRMQLLRFTPEVLEVFWGERTELLKIVFDLQVPFVQGWLPDDGVKKNSHPWASGR
jgi:hypothetical protein